MSASDTAGFRPESALRKEDRRLVMGEGRYVGDIGIEGLLTAAFVRSTIAHGTINEIDTEDADAMPGVVTVLTAADLDIPPVPSADYPKGVVGMDRPILAGERVMFSGEAVALVVAEDAATAVDAAMAVWPDIDPLPVVITAAEALDAPPIHPGTTSNLVEDVAMGDADAGWDLPIVTETNVVNQRVAPTPIEPMAAIAIPEGDGVRIIVGHQAPHLL
jgi:carbon-monoxide dehydrogenase large subunit